MTDVEIISKLCEIDNYIRQIKKTMEPAAKLIKQFGMRKLPPDAIALIPNAINGARELLEAKNALRVQLWKEYGIFYWSDV